MKKLSIFFVPFIFCTFYFVFVQSCNKNEEAISVSANFWNHDGSNLMAARAVTDLQKSVQTKDLYDLVKGQPLWEEGAPAKFQGQKATILIIPVKSEGKNKIENLLLVDYESGKLNYQIVSSKSKKTPLRNKFFWRGYRSALEKELFNASNNSPGFKITSIDGKVVPAGARVNCTVGCVEICFEDTYEEDGQTITIEECWKNCGTWD